MRKQNEKMQRMAEQYWRKLESGGMAYELMPQTLVVGSFRDGLESGLAAHRAEILKLQRENAALRKALEFVVAAYKEEDWPYVMADNFYAVSCVARIALNGKEAQP